MKKLIIVLMLGIVITVLDSCIESSKTDDVHTTAYIKQPDDEILVLDDVKVSMIHGTQSTVWAISTKDGTKYYASVNNTLIVEKRSE